MKAKYIFGLVLASMMATTSCSDFLEEDPKGQFTATSFYQTQDEINLGLVALYQKARDIVQDTDRWHTRWQGEDVTAVNLGNKARFFDFDVFQQTPDTQNLPTIWQVPYKCVKAANGILNLEENIKANAANEYEAGVALGMAHFMRAYAYYDIVKKFGPCILNLDNADDNNETQLSSTKDVYAQILKDLEDAEKLLPASYETDKAQNGIRCVNGVDVFPTKWACIGIRTAVYMSMAGYPLNDQSKYAAAATEADKIIKSGKFSLMPEFKQVYSLKDNFNKETVWGLSNSKKAWDCSSNWSSAVLPGHIAGGWYDIIPTVTWWESFPEGPRKEAIYAEKMVISGSTVDWFNDLHVRATGGGAPYFRTYACNKVDGALSEEAYDPTLESWNGMTTHFRHPVLRYSEILLFYCEAMARTGSTAGKQYLNDVRARAGLAGTAASTAAELAEAALMEHKWETTGSMTSVMSPRDDLFRIGGEAGMKAQCDLRNNPVPTKNTYGGKKFADDAPTKKTTWDKGNMYCPYPAADAALNKNLTRANAQAIDGTK